MKQLAIRLGYQTTPAKSLAIRGNDVNDEQLNDLDRQKPKD